MNVVPVPRVFTINLNRFKGLKMRAMIHIMYKYEFCST